MKFGFLGLINELTENVVFFVACQKGNPPWLPAPWHHQVTASMHYTSPPIFFMYLVGW